MFQSRNSVAEKQAEKVRITASVNSWLDRRPGCAPRARLSEHPAAHKWTRGTDEDLPRTPRR
jgi:hypothetical protein